MAQQRLDKIIASTGRYSRREVKTLVREGRVLVDGRIAASAEDKCDPLTARISVNGQKADRDVFLTLLDQILTMPVVTIPPFVPADEATVTLTLVTDSAQYTAAFYRDGDEEIPYISIISGGTDAPCYQRTDRWRLGTMLLACEGTRIQDEQGAETPMGND